MPSTSNSPPPLKLIRQDSIGSHGQVRTFFVDASSEKPLYAAYSQHLSSLDAHRTVLYDSHKQNSVGAVSLEYLQIGGDQRVVKASKFYRRPHFLSEKQTFTTMEGQVVRWKWIDDGTLVLVGHKTKQRLVTVQVESLAPSATSQMTVSIHPSLLLTSRSSTTRPISTMSSPLSSPESKKQPSSKISRKSQHISSTSIDTRTLPVLASTPITSPPSTSTTLELVLLSLLHQDYLRAEFFHQRQAEADERSNEWDPW